MKHCRTIHGTSVLMAAGVGLLFSGCAAPDHSAEPRAGTLQFPRYALSAVTDGRWVYVFGGSHLAEPQAPDRFPSALTATYERIDPETLEARFYAEGLYRRANHGSLFVDSTIASFGGRFQHGPSIQKARQNEAFHVSSLTSREIAPLPEPLRTVGVASHRDTVYVIGGARDEIVGGSLRQTLSNRVYMLATLDGAWERGPNMIHAREGAVAVVGDRIYAIGGYDGGNALRSVQVYDTNTRSWSLGPQLPYSLSAFSLVVLGPYVIMFGDYERMSAIHRYDTESGELTLLERQLTPRRHSAAVKLDDRVFVIGGNQASPAPGLGVIEVFELGDLLP